MIRRIWIHNYKCFVNFEFRPEPFQFIMGENGSGKTALWEALRVLRDLTAGSSSLDTLLPSSSLTRWISDSRQAFVLEVELDHDAYAFRLAIERDGQARPRIVRESVDLNGKPIFAFENGEVQLFDDEFAKRVAYPFTWYQSALATIYPRPENTSLTRFKNWLANLYFIKINPFNMDELATGESPAPSIDLSNYASWYRELTQSAPERVHGHLREDLKNVLPNFRQLSLQPVNRQAKILVADFDAGSQVASFFFRELSDGQRTLIALYTLLHCSVVGGRFLYLDEPENFVALREIEPWLAKLEMQAEDHRCQVFLASHHPEFINRLAIRHGVQLVRQEPGFVGAQRFEYGADEPLTPAELVARGWNE